VEGRPPEFNHARDNAPEEHTSIFNNLVFAAFYPIVYALYLVLRQRETARNVVLLVATEPGRTPSPSNPFRAPSSA
jgi:hypothetical protein